MKNCFMVNTLRRYTGIQIKSVCIYSDFVCFSINFFKHACRHPEKCLCVVKRNFFNVWTSIIWVRNPGQTNHISYLSSFPPCQAPVCGSRPRAWLCHPPWCGPSPCPHSALRCLPCQSPITERVVAVRQWFPYLVTACMGRTRYKDFTFNIRLAPSCRTWDKTG